MPRFDHKELLRQIRDLSEAPDAPSEKRIWLAATPQLNLLLRNAREDRELVVHTDGPSLVVNSLFVPDDHPSLATLEDALTLRTDSFLNLSATYAQSIGPDGEAIHIKEGGTQGERSPLFLREYNQTPYWEVQQDYAHLAGAHFRPEESAYCRFDEYGDVEHVVSITQGNNGVSLVSFLRQPLEEYLAVSQSVLIRAFTFTFRADPSGTGSQRAEPWEPASDEVQEDGVFAHRIVDELGISNTWGTQVVRPSLSKADVLRAQRIAPWEHPDNKPVDFVVQDFRNDRIATVSTDPGSTVTYFQARGSDLPFETSPAFFKPDVLSKYKQDREKYTLESSSISCRGGWRLRYDRNGEEQISVIIHDLRRLPHREQVYWQSFNEEPKGGLSQRAIDIWYRGRPSDNVEPLDEIRAILREWHSAKVPWWTLGSEDDLNHVAVPGQSRKDWADSFSELAKLIIEGFQVKPIRTELENAGIPFHANDGSLAVLEKLSRHTGEILEPGGIEGLRAVQKIRSKAAAHRGGGEADTLWAEAQTFDSPSAHFRAICQLVHADLKAIDRALDPRYQYLKRKYG